jgi:hypothetical protein
MMTQNEISDYFTKALTSFENDPPDTPHTEGYHDALVALLAQHGEPLVPTVKASKRLSKISRTSFSMAVPPHMRKDGIARSLKRCGWHWATMTAVKRWNSC